MRHFPVILSAPSGAGKTSIAKKLLSTRPDVGYSVSCTTRSPRTGEVEGRDYYFVSQDEFARRVSEGEFAEHADVHGRRYGTLRREVERVLGSGRHVLMDIDVQGAASFSAAFPDAVTVFVLPPSSAELVSRLLDRRTEGPDALQRRLRNARDELMAAERYQYVVVNDVLDEAAARVGAIIDAEAQRRSRNPEFQDRIGTLVAELEEQIRGLGS